MSATGQGFNNASAWQRGAEVTIAPPRVAKPSAPPPAKSTNPSVARVFSFTPPSTAALALQRKLAQDPQSVAPGLPARTAPPRLSRRLARAGIVPGWPGRSQALSIILARRAMRQAVVGLAVLALVWLGCLVLGHSPKPLAPDHQAAAAPAPHHARR